MRINHNSMAYTANNNLTTSSEKLAKAVERLSSGYKVNSSKDDAAGMAISQRMQAQIRGLDRATQNANDGIGLIQTAEGTLGEIQAMMSRMEELATQAANDSMDFNDRQACQDEINKLIEELNRITDDMDFNGRKLLNGDVCRRNYSSDPSVVLYDLSSAVEEDDYGLKITEAATKATASTTVVLGENYKFSEEEAGIITVNGYEVPVTAGMTMRDLFGNLVEACDHACVDYFAYGAEGPEGESVPFEEANGLAFRSQNYGSEGSIEVNCDNKKLAQTLGLNNMTKVDGKDCVAEFTKDADGSRVGFSNTAAMRFVGEKVIVTDRNGFEMQFKSDPDEVKKGPVEATVRVLEAGPINLQIGAFEGENIKINIPKIDSETLRLDKISVFTHDLAATALDRIQEASKKISRTRSYLGAQQNRLQYSTSNLEATSENMTGALSGIMDTDMAAMMTEYTAKDVLSQSATAMLSKANALPENLLQLIQG
ncbi:MAG: hypothetical protein IKQ71_00580 [Lachnospiraceae bacterium]|nr:hypothetical protein [Lachnospiraceae bacterium]